MVDGISGGITPGNNNVRQVTPAGAVTTFAGLAQEGSDDGVRNQAQFYHPRGVAVDRVNGLLHCAAEAGPSFILHPGSWSQSSN